MEQKHFKAGLGQLIVGIGLVLFAALMEFICFTEFLKEKDGIILVIAANVIFIIWAALYGVISISLYFKNAKNIKKAISKYGEDRVKEHIKANQQLVYTKGSNSTYFTDKVIVDFTQGVIPYNMIAFAHMTKVKSEHNTSTSIYVRTYDYQTYIVCKKISGEEADRYLAFLYEKNPNMMVGYSDEAQQKYFDLTDDYKAGKITIEDVNL